MADNSKTSAALRIQVRVAPGAARNAAAGWLGGRCYGAPRYRINGSQSLLVVVPDRIVPADSP